MLPLENLYPFLLEFCARILSYPGGLGRGGAGCHGSSFSWNPCSFLSLSRMLNSEALSLSDQEPFGGASCLLLASKNEVPLSPVPVHLGMNFSLLQKLSFELRNLAGAVGGNPMITNTAGKSCLGLGFAQVPYGINWVGRPSYLLTYQPSVWNVAQGSNLRGLRGWS